jgi:Kef-type K+ transport system membrane component KefB
MAEGASVDIGMNINAVDWSLTAVSGLLLGIRLYVKLARRRGLWWDDHLLLASWVSMYGGLSFVVAALTCQKDLLGCPSICGFILGTSRLRQTLRRGPYREPSPPRPPGYRNDGLHPLCRSLVQDIIRHHPFAYNNWTTEDSGMGHYSEHESDSHL